MSLFGCFGDCCQLDGAGGPYHESSWYQTLPSPWILPASWPMQVHTHGTWPMQILASADSAAFAVLLGCRPDGCCQTSDWLPYFMVGKGPGLFPCAPLLRMGCALRSETTAAIGLERTGKEPLALRRLLPGEIHALSLKAAW